MSDLQLCCTNYKPRHAREIKSELKVIFKCITPVPKIFQNAMQKKFKIGAESDQLVFTRIRTKELANYFKRS